jgi:hypothetical protein
VTLLGKHLEEKSKGETNKFYQVMAIPTLFYGSECWLMKRKEMFRN